MRNGILAASAAFSAIAAMTALAPASAETIEVECVKKLAATIHVSEASIHVGGVTATEVTLTVNGKTWKCTASGPNGTVVVVEG
jgi:hypothetical protein